MRYAVIALGLSLICVASPASSEEEYPFPQLQTDYYCKTLVAKMLDAKEQATELTKCQIQETLWKARLEPWWSFVDPRTKRMIVKVHYKEPKHQTYITLLQYTSSAIGIACLSGQIECKNPKAP